MMRLRLCLGAALLSACAALNAGPAFAQSRTPIGTVCLENAGAFVIGAKFTFVSKYRPQNRTVDVGQYPVLQTRCTDFYEYEAFANIDVTVVGGVNTKCRVFLNQSKGKTITARMEGTTLFPECR